MLKRDDLILTKRVRVINNRSKARIFADLKPEDVLRIEYRFSDNRQGQAYVTFINERTGRTDTKYSGVASKVMYEMEFEEVTE